MSGIEEAFERYDPKEDTAIAQELFDQGLIWAINQFVLHREGYAIGVACNKDNPEKVTDIFFMKVPESDPDGELVFTSATGTIGYTKYLAAQHAKASDDA